MPRPAHCGWLNGSSPGVADEGIRRPSSRLYTGDGILEAMKPMRSMLMCLLCWACLLPQARADAFDDTHAAWTELLQRHVHWQPGGHASGVDYAGFAADRAALQAYLGQLAAVRRPTFDGWTPARRQAFLINAYNAFTVELILDRYPDLDSIRELGSLLRSPWKRRFFDLLGEPRSLDDVEHGLLRGADDFAEPRIHFAVNCASIGCPALRPEAYRHDVLDAQLADQTRRFLSDRSRNRVGDGRLEVSRLFDWYADDFVVTGEHATLAAPLGFLARHADLLADDPATRDGLRRGALRLGYTDYDWRLNRRSAAGDRPAR